MTYVDSGVYIQHKSTSDRKAQCFLSLHQTGQSYKKIHGQFYHFGTDKDQAVNAYPEQATFLHTSSRQKVNDSPSMDHLDLMLRWMDTLAAESSHESPPRRISADPRL
jgi:hypothetical protein